MAEVVIVGAKRTPFGKFGGRLAGQSPVQLAAHAARGALQHVDPQQIDQVILGNVLSAGHGMNIARQVAIEIGLPVPVSAFTVNMMCGSGLQAALLAAQSIQAGQARAILLGGVESMSQSALLVPRPPKGQTPDLHQVVDSMQRDGLVDSFSNRHMGETVEELAAEFGITREQQDAFAERSQKLYDKSHRAGRFSDEISELPQLSADEHPRPEVTRTSLSQLRTVFLPPEQGTITAGNASGINDGAAMLVMADAEFAERQGWPVLAVWNQGVVVGCDPQRMGLGPVAAIHRLLENTGRTLGDIDTLEINEAFAAQTLACVRSLNLSLDLTGVTPVCRTTEGAVLGLNSSGGAIAIGHPLAASGARLLTHLTWQIAHRNSRCAVAALCVGGGMGISAMISAAPETGR